MSDRKQYYKSMGYALLICFAVAIGIRLVAPHLQKPDQRNFSLTETKPPVSSMESPSVEPAAGNDSSATMATPPLPKVSEADLKDPTELEQIPQATLDNKSTEEVKELPPLQISPDKPEIIRLDADAVNVMVGSEETLRAVPDSNRTIILIPKKPGATYIKVTNADGKIILQRHVIVGSPTSRSQYIRIRRACASTDTNCKPFSLYYCPDTCHEVSLVQGDAATQSGSPAPSVAPAAPDTSRNDPNSEPIQE